MSNDNLTFGIKIKADGSGFSGEVKVARDALDKLGQSTRTAAADTGKLNAAQQMLTGVVKQAAAAFSIYKVAEYGMEIARLAARHETLGVAMNAVGKNAGYGAAEMQNYAAGVQKMGITMMESRESVMRMAQASIDLSKSQQLARIAQDAAVIGNVNSSEALATLIHGIQSAQTDVLRTIGINVNFEESYKKLALQLRKTTDDLSESEQMTARTNAVMESGTGIAGTYEAAMGTAGKQMSSLARYSEDAKVKIGAVFSDTLLLAVAAYTGHLKEVNAGMDELADNKKLDQWSEDVAANLAFVADSIKYSFGSVATVLDTAYTGLDQILHLLAANPSGAADSGSAYANRLRERFDPGSSLQVLRKEMATKRELDARTVWEPGSTGKKPAYQWSDASGKAAFEEQEAFIKGAQNAIARGRSEAETEWGKFIQSTRSNQEKMAQEIKKAQNAAATLGGDTAKQLPNVIAAIRNKYDSGYNDAHLARLKAQQEQTAKIEDATAKASLARLESLHKAQLISDESYYAQKRDAQLAALTAEENALQKEMQAQSRSVSLQIDPAKREQALGKLIDLGTRYQEVVIRKTEAEKDGYEWVTAQNKAYKDLEQSLLAAKTAVADFSRAQDDASGNRRFESSLTGIDLRQAEILREQQNIEKEAQSSIRQLKKIAEARGESADWEISEIRRVADASKESAAAEIAARQAVARAWDTGATTAVNAYLDTVGNAAAQSSKLFTDAFKGMEDALVNFVKTGKLDFRSLTDSIISDLIRMQVQQSITKPLVLAASNFFSGIFGMHDGGIVGQDSSFTRAAPLSLWAGASRYHTGGIIGPGERPIIAQDGEEVLTRSDPRHRYNQRNAPAGGDINFTVNIEGAPSTPQIQQQPDGNGGMSLDIIFEKVDNYIAGGINSGRGATAVSLTRTFGLNRASGAFR